MGFALAKELKRLPFFEGAGLLEAFEEAWETGADADWDFDSSGLLASAFAGGASFCNGRLAGTVDSVEDLGLTAGAFAAGAFAAGAGGGRGPVLRYLSYFRPQPYFKLTATYLDVMVLNHTPLFPALQWIILRMCTSILPAGVNQHIQVR